MKTQNYSKLNFGLSKNYPKHKITFLHLCFQNCKNVLGKSEGKLT